jgi:hypothetical protein
MGYGVDKIMSCRTGPLRVARPLRGVCTGHAGTIIFGPPVGRDYRFPAYGVNRFLLNLCDPGCIGCQGDGFAERWSLERGIICLKSGGCALGEA